MVQAPSTPSTIGTTHGTPASVPKLARLMSEMATTTMPAAAINAIFSPVRPALAAAPTPKPQESPERQHDARHGDPAHRRIDGARHQVEQHLHVGVRDV